jgi:hypothetical protein
VLEDAATFLMPQGYVMNNPLKYTDPSGYLWNPFKAVANGSLARQSPLRLSPKAVYAMRSTMLPCPSVMVSIQQIQLCCK